MMKTIVLNQNTPSVAALCKKDKRLAKVISLVGTIEYRPHEDGYGFLVHEIIEQMLSVKAGNKIYQRLEIACGGEITPKAINALSDEQIKGVGTANSKVAFIRALTDEVVSGSLVLSDLENMSDAEVLKRLTAIYGIGQWTAKMYLIFVLNRPDVLPYEDVAFQQVYKWLYKTGDVSKETVQAKCKKWRPYSSIAARFFYRALDIGLTKEEFHLFKD